VIEVVLTGLVDNANQFILRGSGISGIGDQKIDLSGYQRDLVTGVVQTQGEVFFGLFHGRSR